jgi:hypothetical protein
MDASEAPDGEEPNLSANWRKGEEHLHNRHGSLRGVWGFHHRKVSQPAPHPFVGRSVWLGVTSPEVGGWLDWRR